MGKSNFKKNLSKKQEKSGYIPPAPPKPTQDGQKGYVPPPPPKPKPSIITPSHPKKN